MEILSKSAEETGKAAESFILKLTPKEISATIVGLYGNLGSGKTTFVQSAAKTLGVSENVLSPTFLIFRRYALDNPYFESLIHVDAYRLVFEEEIRKLGWKELISNPKNLVFVEWPENIPRAMPEHIKIFFSIPENEEDKNGDINQNIRKIVF
ncbi:MAG: tRNA (adenosine(37)-N6)-threonylcarbamoyltransferase complex ATPase subunit type 1 TsaE [bacterium]|nr:tRNA (adenosine(37)-N6)-threonylcarbamoyltransferase complex ATPase subunit type 1 TsaE [bacterium]